MVVVVVMMIVTDGGGGCDDDSDRRWLWKYDQWTSPTASMKYDNSSKILQLEKED